jgi:hypothetical protein
MSTARVVGSDDLRVFRLSKEDFQRVIKLYPMDEDVLYENLSRLASEHKKDTASHVGSSHHTASMVSTNSYISDMSMAADAIREQAMGAMERAKRKSKEMRVRSFCDAAFLGDMDLLQRLMKSGIDINGSDVNGR